MLPKACDWKIRLPRTEWALDSEKLGSVQTWNSQTRQGHQRSSRLEENKVQSKYPGLIQLEWRHHVLVGMSWSRSKASRPTPRLTCHVHSDTDEEAYGGLLWHHRIAHGSGIHGFFTHYGCHLSTSQRSRMPSSQWAISPAVLLVLKWALHICYSRHWTGQIPSMSSTSNSTCVTCSHRTV